jgi:hypothetical protein
MRAAPASSRRLGPRPRQRRLHASPRPDAGHTGLPALANQLAEDPSPPYFRGRQVGGGGHGDVVAVWWPQVPGSVRAMVVAVRGVFIQDRAQVPWLGDHARRLDSGAHDPGPAAWKIASNEAVKLDRRSPAECRICHTVDGATVTPSFMSSPWIRRCPRSGFSLARRTIRRAMLGLAGGRPGLRRLLVSYFLAASLRCQASNVAGVTGKTSGQRLRGTSRASAASQTRSAGSYRTRPACRRSTAFSCRSTSSSASFARSPRNTRTPRPNTRHVST